MADEGNVNGKYVTVPRPRAIEKACQALRERKSKEPKENSQLQGKNPPRSKGKKQEHTTALAVKEKMKRDKKQNLKTEHVMIESSKRTPYERANDDKQKRISRLKRKQPPCSKKPDWVDESDDDELELTSLANHKHTLRYEKNAGLLNDGSEYDEEEEVSLLKRRQHLSRFKEPYLFDESEDDQQQQVFRLKKKELSPFKSSYDQSDLHSSAKKRKKSKRIKKTSTRTTRNTNEPTTSGTTKLIGSKLRVVSSYVVLAENIPLPSFLHKNKNQDPGRAHVVSSSSANTTSLVTNASYLWNPEQVDIRTDEAVCELSNVKHELTICNNNDGNKKKAAKSTPGKAKEDHDDTKQMTYGEPVKHCQAADAAADAVANNKMKGPNALNPKQVQAVDTPGTTDNKQTHGSNDLDDVLAACGLPNLTMWSSGLISSVDDDDSFWLPKHQIQQQGHVQMHPHREHSPTKLSRQDSSSPNTVTTDIFSATEPTNLQVQHSLSGIMVEPPQFQSNLSLLLDQDEHFPVAPVVVVAAAAAPSPEPPLPWSRCQNDSLPQSNVSSFVGMPQLNRSGPDEVTHLASGYNFSEACTASRGIGRGKVLML